ncbi:MAG TPA: MarR family winged helix-turn-helix transcriptional regulator [Rugosimonospora sp.]
MNNDETEAAVQPRWLDEEEMSTWFALASVLMWLPSALDAQLECDAGISHFEYQVLAMLSMSPERTARMSELAALTNGTLSRLSHVVTRLEKQGWVTRAADSDNRRYTLATLTASGWDKVTATAPGHVNAVRSLVFDPLTRAQAIHLRDIASRIRQAIDPNGELPAPPTRR